MKKILIYFLSFLFSYSLALAETFYFKDCKISNAVYGDYIINVEKNIIEVELKALDGNVQYFEDKIKLIEKNKITSEKIKSDRGKDIYYQYLLNSKTKSVIKLEYKKEGASDMEIFRLSGKRTSSCENIKADWNKRKIEETKISEEQKQILKAQEKIKKEQSKLIKCQGNNQKIWNDCKGAYIADTGHKYNGLFKNGEIIKGISIYPGGAKYIGTFKNYEPHGYGTFFWANGDKYYGAWKDGKTNGNGTKIWKNGRKYLGTFKEDRLHGKGTMFYPDGKKYAGEFINGKRHGEGTFTYTDGRAYIGTFVDGKEKGVGICISEDGETVPCTGKTETQTKEFSGKDTRKISIVAKKWIRISQYESNTKKGKKVMDKLKEDFEIKAAELCAPKSDYKILRKRMEVLEADETPAYGLETKLKIGINGIVECL